MAGLPGDFWVNDIGVPVIPTGFDVTNWDKMFLGPLPKAWPGIVKIDASVSLSVESVNYTTELTKFLPPEKQIKQTYLVDNGYTAGQVRATIAIWDRISWLSLRAFMATVAPDTTKAQRPAYNIRHPATALLGISSVIIDGFAVHPPEEQTLYVEIMMTQWFPYLVSKPTLSGGPIGAVAAVLPDAGGNLA
jgi:hypothetical protein